MAISTKRIRHLLAAPNPVKWVFTGDSITQGVLHTNGGRDYTELFKEQICYTLSRKLDVVINTAVNGWCSRDVLRDFEWRIGQFAPDVLFIMLGMNDCTPGREVRIDQFRDNLRQIVQRSRQLSSCEVVLQTACSIIAESAPERAPYLASYMDALRAVAHEEETILIDHTKYWEAQIAAKPLHRTLWMDDAIHPNAAGHQIFAELLFKELNLQLPDGN